MAIPTQTDIMPALLEMVSHGREFRLRDMVEDLGDHFSLTREEREERVPSGDGRFFKLCGWAQHRLKIAGLLESTRRSYHRITERGLEELGQNTRVVPKETEESRRGSMRTAREWEELKEDLPVSPSITEEAVRRIVREEIERVKQELKGALSEVIDKM
ncbi:MAG: hypothetical protein OXN17_15470 [Candidatus Poribacteria bacterium]|nr:hypothetical protein [Candidatus Poribacteria bacterium]MDE0503797.1 hypothetical protein [Candidatus Poribacteria bacterium]